MPIEHKNKIPKGSTFVSDLRDAESRSFDFSKEPKRKVSVFKIHNVVTICEQQIHAAREIKIRNEIFCDKVIREAEFIKREVTSWLP